ncbi:MAG: class I SAM-dependent methyltransferase [Acidobacteriota bacterium]
MNPLRQAFGDIDIYLFDQLLRGRITPGMRILDAGCGGGRNLVYFLRQGFDVYACDRDRGAVETVKGMAAQLAPALPADHFRVESIEAMSFPDAGADVLIASAVLHFAEDKAQFEAMVAAMWRVLAPGGMLFTRLASSIGIADRVRRTSGGRFHMPDGSERYLVDEAALLNLTARLGGVLLDPIKTTVVQDQRAMTTWLVGKPTGA